MPSSIFAARFTRRTVLSGGSAAAAALALAACGQSAGPVSSSPTPASSPSGFVDESAALSPFDENAAAGAGPQGLPRRVGGLLPGTTGQLKSVDAALRAGAVAAGLEYVSAMSSGTEDDYLNKGTTLLDRGVAGLYVQGINQEAEVPLMKKAIEAGINVANVAFWPCTMQINGSQEAAGTKQAQAAVKWIEANVGKDKAVVVYINNANIPNLLPRDKAIRGVFAQAGIKIVADQTPTAATANAGFTLMSTILQQHADANVILALGGIAGGVAQSMTAAGKTGPQIYVSAGNPEPDELEQISQGTVLKAGTLFPFEPMAYALGPLTERWLAGKTVPMGITVPGGNVLLDSPEAVAQYRQDLGDLDALYKSSRFKNYVGFWGTTKYADHAAHDWTSSWQQASV